MLERELTFWFIRSSLSIRDGKPLSFHRSHKALNLRYRHHPELRTCIMFIRCSLMGLALSHSIICEENITNGVEAVRVSIIKIRLIDGDKGCETYCRKLNRINESDADIYPTGRIDQEWVD
ncbi:hypothetical protein KSP40_PGU011073 [Platanthera guangdongensis]|uniref:Uncharacterized protein n=1 Tax=Platanthera guangdongensis TaxID=2320717 RepID=A0ABR2LKL5_9ASPA